MKLLLYLLICLIFLFTLSTFAQKERDMGIEFYKKGDYESAIKYLSLIESVNKKDGDFWYLLGMSYFKISRFNESRIALEKGVKLKPQNAEFRTTLAFANFEANRLKQAEKDAKKAIKLDPQNATAYYIRGLVFLRKGKYDNAVADADQSINLDRSKGDSYLLKSDAILYKFGIEYDKGGELAKIFEPLQKSIETLEACIANCSQDSALIKTQTRSDDLRVFYEYFLAQKNLGNNSNDDSNLTSLSLLKNPKANYTDSARQSQVQGTINLAVFFSKDGNTKKILALNQLSRGLTEQAIAAAKQIRFTPQMKDGKPVSVVKMVQYSFTLY
jgi:tetratricopeptide (TPR) repeat protein